jgi:hypothetical protein
MAGPYGMLGLGAPEQMRDQRLATRRSQAMDYARLTPAQQSSFNASNAAQMTGEGIGELLGHGAGMLTGSDTRRPEDKLQAVQAQMAQAMKNIDPTDVDAAYPVMIKVLQANGMTPEAMAMAKEYEALKLQKQDRKIKEDDLTRKTTKDAQDAKIAQAKLEVQKPGSPMMQLLNEKQRLEEKKAAGPLTEAEENKLVGINAAMDDRKIQLADRGNMIEVVIDGVPTGRTMAKAASPDAELRAAATKQAIGQMESIYGAQDALNLVKEAQALISGSTGSLLGAARDGVYAAFGVATPEAAKLAQLKVIAGTLLSKFERLPGPVSDFEMKSYQQANGDLASATTPNEAKAAALMTMMKLFQTRLTNAQSRAPAPRGAAPTGTQPKPTKRYNPVTRQLEAI